MTIYSTINYLLLEGQKDGQGQGRRDGACKQLAKLLLRNGKRQYGPPTEEQRAAVQTLADRLDEAQLHKLQSRFLRSAGWAELLDGLASPPEPPGQPEYLQPYEFSPTPMPPSFDEYAKVSLDGVSTVVHLRFQRKYQKDLGAILYQESKRLTEEYGGPNLAAVLLMWPGADGPGVTGEWQPPQGPVFRYQLTRLWERNVDEMFGNPATIAMVCLAKFDETRLPEIFRRMEECINAEPDEECRANMWCMAYQCMGLRFPAEQVNELMAHVMPLLRQQPDCKSALSAGYYEGFSEGQSEGALQATLFWVVLLGIQRLGEPELQVTKALYVIPSLERLEQLAGRVCKAKTWQEVFAMN